MIKPSFLGISLLTLQLMLFAPSDGCNHSKPKSNMNDSSNQTSNTQKQLTGQWGGQGISLQIEGTTATVTFDCAHGEISETMVPDGSGKFAVKGTFTKERGGPTREDDVNTGSPATYSGIVEGDSLQLTITLNATKEQMGNYTLMHGKAGRIRRCM
jgi:hypothetical protein